MLPYLKDPQQIEVESFAQIRAATDLSGFDPAQQQLVLRLVHTCGDPAIVTGVRISPGAITQALDALNHQAAILCDVEMVRHALARRLLARAPLCFLNDPAVAAVAKRNQATRTMTALDKWSPFLSDSIVVIGNAPTALFRLLEMLEAGCAKPRVIIGMPVGFVGAAEAKHYLWQHAAALGVECITLRGRSGGSALAAAACNALLHLQHGVRF